MGNRKGGLKNVKKENFFRSNLVLDSMKSKIAFFVIVFLFGVVISIGILDENIPVYNLEVEGNHNYYAESYLAHNKFIVSDIV